MIRRLLLLLMFALVAGWGFIFGEVLIQHGFGWMSVVSVASVLFGVLNAIDLFARYERRAERARIQRIVQMIRGGGA